MHSSLRDSVTKGILHKNIKITLFFKNVNECFELLCVKTYINFLVKINVKLFDTKN